MKKCKHFGICGGCSLQEVPYEEQLINKQHKIEELFSILNPVEIRGITPSPEPFYYRNKMEFVFDRLNGKPKIGLRMKGRFDKIIDLEECLIFSERAGFIFDSARQWAKDIDTDFLRFMVVRESKKNGTLMVNLILRATMYVFENELKRKCLGLPDIFLKNGIKIDCLTAGLNRDKSEVAYARENVKLSGSDYIEERLGMLKFRIFPYTFFQTNSSGAEVLYNAVSSFINPVPESTCIDVYCGAGCIGLWVSGTFEKVIGIEQNPLSAGNAEINAHINNISNCDFVAERAEIFLDKLPASKFQIKLSTVIVDPPRPGIAKGALESIINLNPPQIIYVSCKPETMFDDLKKLTQLYKIRKIQPIDMFPHTPHVELAAHLVHR